MVWNYRVCRQTVSGATTYSVREVYYEEDGITVRGTTPASVADWSSVDELRGTLDLMRAALDKPIVRVRQKVSA